MRVAEDRRVRARKAVNGGQMADGRWQMGDGRRAERLLPVLFSAATYLPTTSSVPRRGWLCANTQNKVEVEMEMEMFSPSST